MKSVSKQEKQDVCEMPWPQQDYLGSQGKDQGKKTCQHWHPLKGFGLRDMYTKHEHYEKICIFYRENICLQTEVQMDWQTDKQT